MAKLFTDAFYTALNPDGKTLSGAKLNFYVTLTSTRQDTFTDNALTIAHTNPVVADSAGRFPAIYLQALDYKVILTDADDVAFGPTLDPVHGVEAADPADLNADNVFTKTTTWKHGDDVASASALSLDDGNIFDITGTTSITSIGTKGVGTIIVLQFDGVLTLTHNATDLVLPGGEDILTEAGDVAILEEYAVGDWRLVSYQRGARSIEARLPAGYINGLTLSNNGTDALKDIDIAAGTARDDSDAANLTLAATLVKQLDASWAVGTNQGGLDGTETIPGTPDASTWYHCWVIRRSDTGVTDVLFSESATAPTMPTNYDQKRRIGAVLFDATPDILAFDQFGDEFLWEDPPLDVDLSNTLTTTARLDVLSVPTGIRVWARINTRIIDTSSHRVNVSSPDANDEAPSTTVGPLLTHGAAGNVSSIVQLTIRTDTSGQIRARANITVDTYQVATVGWVDPRGRDA